MHVGAFIPRGLETPVACLTAAVWTACSAAAADWPGFLGPTHDGVSSERINRNWTGTVTNPVWLVHLTNGLTSLAASHGRVFTQVAGDLDGDGLAHKEFCVALDAVSGDILWSTETDAASGPLFPDGGVGSTDDGPRSTPVVHAGSVYVLSSYLKLYRLNATNGAVIWQTNLSEGFGGGVIAWQNAASPVVESNLVFVNANTPAASLMAFRLADGTLAWRSQNEAMTHATPTPATIHGVRQIIFATQSGLVAVDPQTGVRLWKFNYPFAYSTSLASSPVVWSNLVFITGFYGMGGATVRVDYTNAVFQPSLQWFKPSLRSHWTTPVAALGCLFGQFTTNSVYDNQNAQLKCIDLLSGAEKWSLNGFGRGATLVADDHLLVLTENGRLVLAALNTNAYTELARFIAIPNYHGFTNKCWNAPAVAAGRVYVRSTAFAAAYDLSVPELQLDPPPISAFNQFSLTIRTANGIPIDSNRLAKMELRASNDPSQAVTLWPQLTNTLVLTNGIVRADNLDTTGQPQRFFIVSEPK